MTDTAKHAAPAIRDRIKSLRRVRAGDLLPHPGNWRTHSQAQRAALKGILREVGWADAVLAYETPAGLQLIDGHLRTDIDPDAKIPVLVLDVTEEEAAKILMTHDPIGALAGQDDAKLMTLVDAFHLDDGALQRVVDDLLPPAEGNTATDTVPDPPEEPVTRTGDLWLLGAHRLLCGDATSVADADRAVQGALPTCMWTDPPYGVSYVGKTRNALQLQHDDAEGIEELLTGSFAAADQVLANGAALYVAHPAGALSVTFGACFLAAGWRLHEVLVWIKDTMVLGHSDYHYRHEPILFGYKRGPGRRGRGGKGWYGPDNATSVFEIPRPKRSTEHPTAKPVELIERMLTNSTAPGETVYEPFAGSGSTIIAAERLGRRCVALEIDPRYVDVAVLRWEAYTGEKAERAA